MYETLTETRLRLGLTITVEEFTEIQTRSGLSDAELGARFFRGPDGGERIRQYRTGEQPISPEIAILMCGLDRRLGGELAAA